MVRHIPKAIAPNRLLSRRKPIKDPLPVVYIFCEGKITEPHYINSFVQEFCRGEQKVIPEIIKGAGVPYTLVEKCIDKKRELKTCGRKDTIQRRSSVWAVFDVDEHPKLIDAVNLAKKHQINFSISNPCIEIWGMMHLSIYQRPLSRHEAQSVLAAAMPPYHHDKSPIIPWEICRDKIHDAMSNSQEALNRIGMDKSGLYGANPSTTFYELLKFILDGE